MAPGSSLGNRFRTALVVEPDDDLRTLYGRLLQREGISRVFTARDGIEALSMATSTPPDLVVTEMALPHLDGVAVLGRLRETASTCRATFVVITGHLTPALHEQGSRLGIAMLLQKPVSFRSLGETLRVGLADANAGP